MQNRPFSPVDRSTQGVATPLADASREDGTELLLSCRSGGDGSRCAALSMQPCELLRQSRATWERLESGAMLAHDYESHAARARELAARCPAT